MHVADHPRWRMFRGALTVALALAWSGITPACFVKAAGATDGAKAGVDRAASIDTLDRLFKLVQAVDSESAAELEPAGVVGLVGKDPSALLKWVQDNTYWAPYQGMLRGSAGVLLDHLGNSLDRSLLLADLLNAAGVEARLARCRLEDRAASEALKKLRGVPANWRGPANQVPDPSDATARQRLSATAARFGIDDKLIDQGVKKAALQGQQLAERIATRCIEQTPALLELAGPAPAAAAALPQQSPASTSDMQAIADHWWVQANVPGHGWTDLDPTFSESDRSALKLPAAQTVFERRQSDPVFAIPEESTHRVEIQVVAERTEGGRRSESVVLSKMLRPIDVLGRKLTLGHVAMGWPDGYEMYSGKDGYAALREAAAKPREWVPVLSIGTEVVVQSGVRADGSVDPKPNLDSLSQTGKGAASAANSVLDVFGGNDAKPEEKPSGQFTAERIDYRLLVPGQPVQVVSRYLFDLTGAKARSAQQVASGAAEPPQSAAIDRSLSLLGQTEMLLQPCAFSPDACGHLITRAVLANRDAILEAARTDYKDAKGVSDWGNKLQPVPGSVYALAACRSAYGRQAACYLDRPSVITSHAWLALRDSRLSARSAFDIVANDVAVHSYAAPTAYAARLAQGLCDTIAEAAVLHAQSDADTMDQPAINASEAFGNDLARHVKWVRLGASDLAKLETIALPVDVRERIRAEIARGKNVILPATPPSTPPGGDDQIVWWSVDPVTGQTLGMAGNGWGAAIPENAVLILRVAAKEAAMFLCIGKALGGGNYGSAALCYLAGGLGMAGVAAGGAVGGVISLVADVFSLTKVAT